MRKLTHILLSGKDERKNCLQVLLKFLQFCVSLTQGQINSSQIIIIIVDLRIIRVTKWEEPVAPPISRSRMRSEELATAWHTSASLNSSLPTLLLFQTSKRPNKLIHNFPHNSKRHLYPQFRRSPTNFQVRPFRVRLKPRWIFAFCPLGDWRAP